MLPAAALLFLLIFTGAPSLQSARSLPAAVRTLRHDPSAPVLPVGLPLTSTRLSMRRAGAAGQV